MIDATQIQQIKQTVDIVPLVARYTKLHKVARSEWAGPCPRPRCGGTDRLHVHADGWFFCRSCHEKRGDAIEFVRFVEGLDFPAACEWLGATRIEPFYTCQATIGTAT